MTLLEIKEKSKRAFEKIERKDFFFTAVILFVGLASFGLGRISRIEESRAPIEMTQSAAISQATPPSRLKSGHLPLDKGQDISVNSGGVVIASKSGTKYHFPWCAGASQISEKNKISFSSIEEARKAGYTPASNCKGLR
jgi:hypothetical protein